MKREFVVTADGSHTLLVPDLGEHYHSVHGALTESLHVFLEAGYRNMPPGPVNVLEVGLGTGLNALLTALESKREGRQVYYEAWEAFPLTPEEAGQLNFPGLLAGSRNLLDFIHGAPFGEEVRLLDGFTLFKVCRDIREFTSTHRFNLVYFDAFGPAFQPELWESGMFSRIAAHLDPGARLVTYSAKGQVRRNLRSAGFLTESAPGPPGKREMTVAIYKPHA